MACPRPSACRRGRQRRLRPVLMTASIAAFGLVPLLFATGPGSEIQRPLAIVVIGGLLSVHAADAGAAADPLSPVRRRSEGGQMTVRTCVPYADRRLASFARSCSTISANSAIWCRASRRRRAGHGPTVRLQTAAEQVKGHADEVLVRIIWNSGCRAIARPAQDGVRRVGLVLDHAGDGRSSARLSNGRASWRCRTKISSASLQSRNGATTSRVSLLGAAGTISKVMPR